MELLIYYHFCLNHFNNNFINHFFFQQNIHRKYFFFEPIILIQGKTWCDIINTNCLSLEIMLEDYSYDQCDTLTWHKYDKCDTLTWYKYDQCDTLTWHKYDKYDNFTTKTQTTKWLHESIYIMSTHASMEPGTDCQIDVTTVVW
jgi:hypothetical protein